MTKNSLVAKAESSRKTRLKASLGYHFNPKTMLIAAGLKPGCPLSEESAASKMRDLAISRSIV